MTIDIDGFLSADINEWIFKHRNENHDWFEFATRLSQDGQKLLMSLTIKDNNTELVKATLFIRGLSALQGAILLAERGMTLEARTLIRGCFETLFYIGAINKDPAFIDKLVPDDAKSRRAIANALLKTPDGLTQADINILTTALKEFEKIDNIKDIKAIDAAKNAGLEGIYDVYYRALSNDAAHPSILSLNRHVKVDTNQNISNLHWGPDVQDVADTLKALSAAGMHLIALMESANTTEQLSAQSANYLQEFRKLTGDVETSVN